MEGTKTTTSDGAGRTAEAPDASTGEQTQLLATAVGDQCANCGARLAGDQRYCLECGQRRGRPRYSLPAATAAASTAPGGYRGTRALLAGNGALLGGIAVLLIAMGVGVLIGRASNSSSPRNLPAITINGATGGTAATTATPTTASTPTSTASSPSSKSSTSTSSKSTSKANSAKAALVAKLPPKAKVIPPALKSKVKTVGQACTNGTKGCTNGKFTGTFFGGGG
jgi:hypothetical protein